MIDPLQVGSGSDTPDQAVLRALTQVAQLIANRDVDPVHGSALSQEETASLRVALEQHPVFGQPKHVFAAGGHKQLQLHPSVVAQTLSRALPKRGPDQTLAWLHKVRALDSVKIRRCAELFGVKAGAAGPVTLSNGVTILAVEDMRSSWQADQAKRAAQTFDHWASDALGARGTAMFQIKEARLVAVLPVRSGISEFQDLEDVALGLSIASPETNAIIGSSWAEFEDADLHDAEFGWGFSPMRSEGNFPFNEREITAEHVGWIERFLALSGDTRKACS
ncbi:MAG: hypothetical protein ABI398_12225, partial [Devosia sp.]